MKSTLLRVLFPIILIAFATVSEVRGHWLGQTYLYLNLNDDTIGVRFEVAPADLNVALNLGLAEDGTVEVGDLEPHADRIEQYLRDNVSVAPGGTLASLRFERHIIRDTEISQYVLSEFIIDEVPQRPEFIDFQYSILLDEDPEQSGVLVIENDFETGTFDNEAGISLVFEQDSRQQQLDLTDSSILKGLGVMIKLGTEHILSGLDHVLFLIAILLPAAVRRVDGKWEYEEKFRPALIHVIKIVTVFTVAHTITLSLAALEILSLPPRLVESVIAGSIAIAAIDIFYPILRRRIVLVVFAFGLFHGAGFASVILSMNIQPGYVVYTLFGFNLGVEIGQLAIVCVAFPLFYFVRTWPIFLRLGVPALTAALIFVSSYWFIERAFNVDLPAGEYVQIAYHKVFGG